MKKFLLAMAIAFLSTGAFAQTNLGANSAQNQQSAATSSAQIQPGAVAISSYGADSIKTTGNAPSLAFGVSFSGDNCYSTAGASAGWLGGAFGVGVPIEGQSCTFLRTYERLQQGAASEADPAMKRNLKDASYEVLAEISPKIRGILSRRGVIHGQAAVAYDQSGTEGMQPASTRVEDKPSLLQ